MKKLICLFSLLLLAGTASAKSKISGPVAIIRDLAVSATPTFDIGDVSRLSVQVNTSSSTVPNVSFYEGRKSTATITVVSNTFVQSSTPVITINGSSITYTPGTNVGLSACAISDAIMANTSLNTIIVSTCNPAGVVSSTSTSLGVNAYSLSSSSWTALLPSNSIFLGGQDGAITSGSDLVAAANGYGVGQGAWLQVNAGSAPSGLTAGTTYFIIPVSNGGTFKFATTNANALAGVVIDISTTTTGGGNYTLVNATTTSGASYVLQGSNDGVNWSALASTGTVVINQPSGISTNLYDAQFLNCRYIRLNYTKPTAGGMDIDVWIQGKNDE